MHPRFFLGALICLVGTMFAQAQTTISVADYGAVANSQADCTVAFRNALAAAKSANGPVTLLVPPGRYDFFRASATKRNCYTSNSTETGSPERTIAIDIQDIDNLTIQGTGATLMMNGRMTLLVAENCENLWIHGLEFDSPRPTFSELTAVSKDGTSWIAQILPDFTYQIENGNKLLWTVDGSGTGYNAIQWFYPDNRTLFRDSRDPIGTPTKVEDLGGGQVKFTGGNLANVVPGVTYQFRYTRRNELGMWFNHCKNVVMDDVSVRAMHGFGILSQFTENVAFRRLVVAPKPGSGRTMASSADITHFSGCKGKILLEDCYLSAAHDDAMNVHGTHLRVVSQPAANKLRVRFMHHQSWGFQAFFPGDEVELVKATDLLSYDSAKVTAVSKVDDYQWDVTLDKNVTVQNLNSDALENITWTPSVEVVNCDMTQLSCRGLLLTTRKPILIQGNRFYRTSMHGILVEDDAAGWYESGPVHDLTIRGNTFYYCAEAVLQLNPHRTGAHAGYIHKNILVEDNDFFINNTAAYAKSVGNLRFSGNRFHLANNTSPTPASRISQADSQVTVAADNVAGPASAAVLKVVNGDFESSAATSQKVAGWFVTNPNSATLSANGGSSVLSLGPETAAYQNLGAWDPAKGSFAEARFDQVAGSGPVTASLVLWDGRLSPADGTSPADLEVLSSRTFDAATAGTNRRITADLAAIPAGSRVWLVFGSATGTAQVDHVSIKLTPAPDTATYSGWLQVCGLTGDDARADADPDGDGIPNLIEYIIADADPLRKDPAPLKVLFDTTSGKPVFRFKPRETNDVALSAEYQTGGLSANGWLPVTVETPGFQIRKDSDGTRWIDAIGNLGGNLFVRLSATTAAATVPTIANPGFENPDRTGEATAYSTGSPANWTLVSSNSNFGVEEIRDARFGAASGAEGSRLNALGGQGDQIGYININGTGTGSATSGPVGKIAPNTEYTLTVALGRRIASQIQSADSKIQLLAGDQPLGSAATVTGASLPVGFSDHSYKWKSGPIHDPAIGQPLRVRLNFNNSTSAFQQAQFDHIRLMSK